MTVRAEACPDRLSSKMLTIVCGANYTPWLAFFMEKRMISVSFGNAVKKRRKALALSQEQLAEKAKLHRTYIGMIERGEKNITLTNIEKIALALGCAISELMEGL